jgi:hypothetical protein
MGKGGNGRENRAPVPKTQNNNADNLAPHVTTTKQHSQADKSEGGTRTKETEIARSKLTHVTTSTATKPVTARTQNNRATFSNSVFFTCHVRSHSRQCTHPV